MAGRRLWQGLRRGWAFALLAAVVAASVVIWAGRSELRSRASTPPGSQPLTSAAPGEGQPQASGLPAVGAGAGGAAQDRVDLAEARAQQLSEEELRAEIERLSAERSAEERVAAIRRLSQSDAPDAIRALWESASDEDATVAEAAVRALMGLGVAVRPADSGASVPDLATTEGPDAGATEPQPDESAPAEPSPVDALRDQLNDPNPAVVAEAIAELETLGTPEAIAALGDLIGRSSTSTALKLRAIEALEWTESSRGIPILRSALWDADPQVANAAVVALESYAGGALSDAAVEAVAEVFRRSGSLDLQVRALEAIGWLEGDRAIALTTQVLEANPTGPLYGVALEILYELGDQSTIPALWTAYSSTSDPGAKQVLADLLDMLGEDVVVPGEDA